MGIGIACMVGVVGLWSIVPILVKQLLAVFDPFTIAFLRSAQGAGFALALLYARGYGVPVYPMVALARSRRYGHCPKLRALCAFAELYNS